MVVVLVETQCSMVDLCEITPLTASEIARPVAPEASSRHATLGHVSSTAVWSPHSIPELEYQRSHALQNAHEQEHGMDKAFFEVKGSQVVAQEADC